MSWPRRLGVVGRFRVREGTNEAEDGQGRLIEREERVVKVGDGRLRGLHHGGQCGGVQERERCVDHL